MTAELALTAIQKSLRLLSKNTLTLSEAAEYIGLSESTVLKMARNRVIASFRPSKSPTFDKNELERWMRKNPVMSMEQIETKAATYNMKKI